MMALFSGTVKLAAEQGYAFLVVWAPPDAEAAAECWESVEVTLPSECRTHKTKCNRHVVSCNTDTVLQNENVNFCSKNVPTCNRLATDASPPDLVVTEPDRTKT